ncbi:MAG: hypothetical protein EOO86_11465 [Pedobacter sp.]|nr:MAG: hypothetical protein EOO86_11465 [Pedobacter sp.]
MGKLLYGPAQSAIGFLIKISMTRALDFLTSKHFMSDLVLPNFMEIIIISMTRALDFLTSKHFMSDLVLPNFMEIII